MIPPLNASPGTRILNPGDRIEKCNSELRDLSTDGARGVVRQRLGPVNGLVGYMVEWEAWPEKVVFVAGHRVRAVE